MPPRARAPHPHTSSSTPHHSGGNADAATRSHADTSDTGTPTRRRRSSAGVPDNVTRAQDNVADVAQQGRPGRAGVGATTTAGDGGTPAHPPASTTDSHGAGTVPDAQLAHDAIHGDVSTEPGQAVFWSGRSHVGPGPDDFVYAGPDNAVHMARDRSMTTLEGLIEERGLNMPDWDADNPAVVQSWTKISERYAAGVSGDVHVILGEQVRPGAVWETEFVTLQRNPNVTSITQIDLVTGRETVLWRRGP